MACDNHFGEINKSNSFMASMNNISLSPSSVLLFPLATKISKKTGPCMWLAYSFLSFKSFPPSLLFLRSLFQISIILTHYPSLEDHMKLTFPTKSECQATLYDKTIKIITSFRVTTTDSFIKPQPCRIQLLPDHVEEIKVYQHQCPINLFLE